VEHQNDKLEDDEILLEKCPVWQVAESYLRLEKSSMSIILL
jgi:hypothetical protein